MSFFAQLYSFGPSKIAFTDSMNKITKAQKNACRMKIFYFVLLLFFQGTSAQNKSSMQGEYFLRGVMETASGFKLNADSTFEFFYSYGALDRYGSGKWRQVNGNIIFESRARPPQDFALIKSEKSPDNFTTTRLVDDNEF